MGLVISTLFRLFDRSKEYRILLLGLDAAGKTAFLYKLKVIISWSDVTSSSNILLARLTEKVNLSFSLLHLVRS